MGGAASTMLQQTSRGDPITISLPSQHHVGVSDKFASDFSAKLFTNQITHVLGKKEGREAYEAFLNREFPEADYDRIENIEDDIDFGGEGKTSLTRKQAKITDIINLYEKPTEFFAAERSFGSDKNPSYDHANDPSDTLVALKAWPLFLESEEYHKWKRDRRKTVIRFRENLEDIIEQDPVSDDESDPTADVKAIPSIESIDLEFSRISKDQLWLTELLSSVEFLPLCVSVASARKGEKGFPLIYVNKFFETTTGYSREQILGQNCKFLQKGPNPGQVAQPSSVARMRSNLHDGKPVKVVVTNYRKDGSPFMNLLALKPIFDSNGEYAFVVGIQFDIGDGNASPERLQMVEKIMSALPDQLAPNVESSKDNNV